MVFPEFSAAAQTGSGGAAAAMPVVMLEGKALLDKARSLSNRPEDQIARACGYVGPSGRLLKKSFYRALILAKGYKLPEAAGNGNGRAAGRPGAGGTVRGNGKGRQAVFRTRVHGNGNLLIGQAYTKLMGLEPGQEFRIELERETGSILLLPLSEAAELNDAAADDDPAAEHNAADEDAAEGDAAEGDAAADDAVDDDPAVKGAASGAQEFDGSDPLA
jgi:bifunctional DNA-binding transcriptional regulator/antitoxin component of YhaV-PrlF toxin-antitoxin module